MTPTLAELEAAWARNPIFSVAGPEVCHAFARRYPPSVYRPGALIFREGDRGGGLHLLLLGTARIFHRAADGRESIVKLLRAPVAFGEIEVFHDLPYLESVDAMERSHVARIPNPVYLAFLLEHPAAMLEQLRSTTAAFAVTACNERQVFASLEQRVANLLLSFADFFGGCTEGQLTLSYPLSQKTIARHLGATERGVSQIVAAWSREGILRKQGQQTILVRPEVLKELARPIQSSLCFHAAIALPPGVQPEAPPEAEVVVLKGTGSQPGRRLAVNEELIVGRRPPCRLLVNDDYVSNQHCRIFRSRTGGRYWLEDLHSENGTSLNGEAVVRRRVLRDGDQIELGGSQLAFRLLRVGGQVQAPSTN